MYIEEVVHDRLVEQERIEADDMFQEILLKWYLKGEI